jgi:hypothetical protein
VLTLRQEKAQLLGFPCFAELSMASKMATLGGAEALLEELRVAAYEAAKKDLQVGAGGGAGLLGGWAGLLGCRAAGRQGGRAGLGRWWWQGAAPHRNGPLGGPPAPPPALLPAPSQELQEYAASQGFEGELLWWDVSYWAERLKEAR